MKNYRKIKNISYNNVKYISNLITNIKGYPAAESFLMAVEQFDDDGIFKYYSVESMLNNLRTYKDFFLNRSLHDYNMQGIH